MLPGRDDIERFKVYIEIAKYAITIVLALSTVAGVIAKQATVPEAWHFAVLGAGTLLDVLLFFICHRLVSEALQCITNETPQTGVAGQLASINRSSYSLFVIVFALTMLYWSGVILAMVVF